MHDAPMYEGELPPILVPPTLGENSPPPEPPKAKWRWLAFVLLLAGYVLGIGLIGAMFRGEEREGRAALPSDIGGLLQVAAVELGIFGFVFSLAWLVARPNAKDLFLNWRGGFKAWLWGLLYSVGLRVGIAIVMLIVAAPFIAYEQAKTGGAAKTQEVIKGMRPDVEAIIEPKALQDPVYLLVMVTFVSFVFAGLREELWRAGMMAGFAGVAPGLFASKRGQVLAVLLAAFIFGLGHLPQGLGGVLLTGALGIGLGLIIVRHQSIWEATIAHGFFDATSFVLLAALSKYAPDALKSL